MRWLKIFIGFAGAVIVGAIGSGLWDLFLKRFVLWCWDGLATIASLGLAVLRNMPYHDAGRGSPHDTVFAFIFFVGCFYYGWSLAGADPRPPVVALEDATPEKKSAYISRRVLISRGILVALFSLAFLQLAQIRLTYNIVDDFNHNIAALSPLIGPKDAANYRFTFTHMKSRGDYIGLLEKMRLHAASTGIELPRDRAK